ncbi:glycosyltransferase family 4 protein [Crocinitomicaceae bacterium]|nr:glycosyltransferase family 4 protein [Crocinitomicaceae bacterium]
MLLELAESLVDQGWDVTVITGFPNHPGGVVYDGYKKQLFQEQWMGNVRIWRVFLHTSARRSYFSRILTFISFTLSSSLCLLFRGKPDLVFAVLQPLSLGAILPLIARLKGARLVFNIQDLHPDAQINLGMIKNRLLIRLLKAVEQYSYRHADGLSVICDAFRDHCIGKGAEAGRIAVIRNWIDLDEIRPEPRINAFRSELGLADEDTVILFAGTIGLASGAEVMLDVAERLIDHRHIRIVFVGEGASLPAIRKDARARGMDNLVFSPFQPRERLSEVQAIADISIVTIRPGSEQMSVPSKVLGYMAAARPVLAAAPTGSETARFISESGAGIVVPPGDPEAIAAAILDLQGRPGEMQALGNRGRSYLEENLTRAHIGKRYNDFFTSLLRE